MKTRLLTLVGACLLGGLGAGCNDRAQDAAAPPPQAPAPAAAPAPAPAAAPAPAPAADASADAEAPTVVEEGATYDGQVVVAVDPATVDWVFVNGGWNYWNPRVNVWVHSVRPSDWRPPAGHSTTIRSWSERPLEHRAPDGRVFRETVVKRAAPRPDTRKPEERREEH